MVLFFVLVSGVVDEIDSPMFSSQNQAKPSEWGILVVTARFAVEGRGFYRAVELGVFWF